jgi:hypothetical protein
VRPAAWTLRRETAASNCLVAFAAERVDLRGDGGGAGEERGGGEGTRTRFDVGEGGLGDLGEEGGFRVRGAKRGEQRDRSFERGERAEVAARGRAEIGGAARGEFRREALEVALEAGVVPAELEGLREVADRREGHGTQISRSRLMRLSMVVITRALAA